MMDNQDLWSGSETESISEQEVEHNDPKLALFSCAENKSTFHYLAANHLKRFILPSEVCAPVENVDILGVSCNPSVMSDAKERKHLFQLIKFNLFELLSSSSSQQNLSFKGSLSSSKMKSSRKHLASFLLLLLSTFKTHNETFNEDLCSEILKDLVSLVKPIGSIYQSPQWIDAEERNTTNYNLFHLRLELKVHLFMVLSALPSNTNSIQNSTPNVIATSLIMDLLIVSNMVYTKIKRRGIGVWNKDPFMCPCCKQAWVIVIQVLKNIQSSTTSVESLWSIVSQCLSDENDTRGNLKNRNNFSWSYSGEMKIWIMSSIAPLYWIDVCGNDTYSDKMVVPGNWITVQEMLQKELTKDLPDDTLKPLLWGCIKLTSHWMPSLDIFNLLLDYFNKKLNDSPKRTSTTGICGYMHKSSSLDPSSQLDCVLSLLVVSSTMTADDSPYEMFLRYAFRVIRRLKDVQSQQMLSQVKKRIYNKFHKRRLHELNQYGVQRFTALFITLTMTLEDSDVMLKMITLLATKTFNNNSSNSSSSSSALTETSVAACRKQVIYSSFTMLHLCAKQENISSGNNTTAVINCIVQRFCEATKHLIDSSRTKELFQLNMDLIQCILKCIEHYFDYTKCREEGLALFCPAYKQLLRYSVELQSTAIFLAHVNRLVSMLVNDDGLASPLRTKALSVFHEVFYDSLEQIYSTAPSEKLTEVFANLTMLSIQSNGSHTQQLLQKHGFDESNKLAHRTFYLSKLLNSQSAITYTEANNHIPSITKIWLSCCVWLPDDAVLLTRNVVQLPTLSRYIINKQCEEFSDVVLIVSQFISGVGQYYNDLDSVLEMSSIRKFLEASFSGFVKDAEQALGNSASNSSAVRTVFEISGKLVKHCAKAIYSKTSPICVLPQLIDLFILPLKSVKKSSLPDYTKMSVRYLHYFLQGMSWLDLKKDDFVMRKMRDITQRYFIDCCMASYKNQQEKNPFLISLLPSCAENPKKHFSDYRGFLLGHITENHLIFPQNPQRLACILNLLVQLVTTTKSQKELFETMKLLLDKILSCVLICDAARSKGEPVAVKKLAVKILKTVRNLHGEDSHKLICDVVKKFVSDHFQNYQATVLKTLQTVYITCPAVVKGILNDVNGIVYANEKKRGVGVDSEIRDALKELHALIDAGTNATRK